jgi:two-component system nitrate/nitrite sensor histidine kinase NarX
VAAALFDQARTLGRRAGFTVDFGAEGQASPLVLNAQLAIIYIFREALINVEKHAQAHKVRIRVVWSGETLSVQLADDGRGFVPERVASDRHFGLKIMHERAEEINARLSLTSRPGAGTQVKLCVPLHNT